MKVIALTLLLTLGLVYFVQSASLEEEKRFLDILSNLNLGSATDKLLEKLGSGVDKTVGGCKIVCNQFATQILGPLQSLSGLVCTPLCEKVIGKLG